MNERRASTERYFNGKSAMEETYETLVEMVASLEGRAWRCNNAALNTAVYKLKRSLIVNAPTKKKLRLLKAQYNKLCEQIATAERARQR